MRVYWALSVLGYDKRNAGYQDESVMWGCSAKMCALKFLYIQGVIIDLNMEISLNAARLGVSHHIPLADSIILATCQAYDAIIWTQDIDFKGLSAVRYIQK